MALWFASRALGLVSLVLLSAVTALGLLTAGSRAPARRQSLLVTGLHRSLSLLSVALIAVHVTTAILDTYVHIGWLAAVVPFTSGYERLWVGLGTFAFDLLLALIVTSLLRARLGRRSWRAVHWLAYACWPVAVVHGLEAGGSDFAVTLGVAVATGLVIASAAVYRMTVAARAHGARSGRRLERQLS
jgi:predicted ferric reductase